jgi:uncharacterized protein (TIGR00730 family)
MTIKSVALFCAAHTRNEDYIQAAGDVATYLARAQKTIIYGGEESGLMKVVADAAEREGGKVVAIGAEHLRQSMRKNLSEVIIAPDNATRNAEFIKRADAALVLPGGVGTLDECATVLRANKWKTIPVFVLNINGFYDGLEMQLARMNDEKCIPESLLKSVHFCVTVEAFIAAFEQST